ncbi:MAG: glycosyltransferase family 9 protein [Opitutaceae bacterium]|nr:glycosyltransferase family 9 protein [Opitutaceae bacterium]
MPSPSTPAPDRRPRLLVVELWGLGDLALAVPFLREAGRHAEVTLLAKSHAAPLLRRFCAEIEHISFTAPWTVFRGKYRLHRWPWREMWRITRELRSRRFDVAVSARRDPRDHVLMRLAGARRRLGFPRFGSSLLLTEPLSPPAHPHRAEHWRSLAETLGWELAPVAPAPRRGRRAVIHTGAGQSTRLWPLERFDEIAARMRAAGWEVTLLDDSLRDLDQLLARLSAADRFIGNDSGPGHLAALLGVPTFTIFGPQLPELFAPQHPQAAWIEGAPCPYKPCFDFCRYAELHCIRNLTTDAVWPRLADWLARG